MSETNKKALILMPIYNDWGAITTLLPIIDKVLQKSRLDGEIVIVDDGSSNFEGRDAIEHLTLRAVKTIEVVDLYRNVGNQTAVAIGMAYCAHSKSADYLVLMDSDGEDDPKYIPELIEACESNQNQNIVFAQRSERSEGSTFKFFYSLYKQIYRLTTGLKISIGNFSVVPWAMMKRISNVAELWSHFPAAIMKAKLPFITIPSKRGLRLSGQSHMNFVNLLKHALSGLTVHAEVVGSRALIASIFAGLFVLSIVGFVFFLKFFTTSTIVGWASQITAMLLILVVQLFTSSVLMLFMVISMRSQPPMIPMLEYDKFVCSTEILFKKK